MCKRTARAQKRTNDVTARQNDNFGQCFRVETGPASEKIDVMNGVRFNFYLFEP